MIYLDQTDMEKNYKIVHIHSPSSIKRRFIDIGLIPGAIIKKVLKNPFGGICAYAIMGSTIAIRDIDARKIEVKDETI